MSGRFVKACRNLKIHDVRCEKTIDKYKLPQLAARNQGMKKQKIINNLVWCNAAVNASNRTLKYKALYIDGPDARTTRILRDAGYNVLDCIPVNDVHFNEYQIEDIVEKKRQTFAECINNGNFNDLSAVWYDGCGTLLGTSKNRPLHDIKQLLDLNNLDGAVLAVTFCTRDRRGVSRDESVNLLENTIKACGYHITTPHIITYPPAMCFWMAHLALENQPLL